MTFMTRRADSNDYIESDDYYDMAHEWIKQHELKKAEECLTKAISLNPYFTYAYITLARIYARWKNYHEAIHTLKKASKIDTDFVRIHYLMAKYACKVEDFAGALKHIDRAVELYPSELYLVVRDLILHRYHNRSR